MKIITGVILNKCYNHHLIFAGIKKYACICQVYPNEFFRWIQGVEGRVLTFEKFHILVIDFYNAVSPEQIHQLKIENAEYIRTEKR